VQIWCRIPATLHGILEYTQAWEFLKMGRRGRDVSNLTSALMICAIIFTAVAGLMICTAVAACWQGYLRQNRPRNGIPTWRPPPHQGNPGAPMTMPMAVGCGLHYASTRQRLNNQNQASPVTVPGKEILYYSYVWYCHCCVYKGIKCTEIVLCHNEPWVMTVC
jgi:hypothetical protein